MSAVIPDETVAAPLLLRRIEEELTGCRAILAKIESAVETLLQSGNVAQDDPLHLAEMQNIDLLDQTIADLVTCLQDMATTPALQHAQLLRVSQVTGRLKLADLSNRLSGHRPISERGRTVELF